MQRIIGFVFFWCFLNSAASAATIYPLDRATILAGSPFDFKVELDGHYTAGDIKVRVNGRDYADILGKHAQYIFAEKAENGTDLGSALIMRDCVLAPAGAYEVQVSAGDERKTVTWQVYQASSRPKVKNVIFFLGDGMSIAHRTGARIMSKGMSSGKANSHLHMDTLDTMALIGTSATDSIANDSAHTMSAYMTGHKAAVKSLGVYADRTPDTLDDPRVETLAEALRRTGKKSLGIVTTAEVVDATPAAVVSHTRTRDDKVEITDMLLKAQPDILLGGGSAYFLPQQAAGSKRKDNKDYIREFRAKGYKLATTKTELEALNTHNQGKILGLFHTSHLDTPLDRLQLKKGGVRTFPDQPGLVDMTRVALQQLAKNRDGFFLMVEGASIDKMSHKMDWDRSLYATIEFDQAIGLALDFAKQHPDTLIIVTADHTHGVSLVGTVDDSKPGHDMREKVGVAEHAGYTNYEDKDQDGFPDRVDVSRRLALFSNNYPDYYETFRPKMDGPFKPVIQNEQGLYVANPAYAKVPGSVWRRGNIPRVEEDEMHAVDDVLLQATGPGAENFKGYMEQSDVYHVLADALGLGGPSRP